MPELIRRTCSILCFFCLLTNQLNAQIKLSGKVIDQEGVAIPFARIGIVDTRVAQMAEFNGAFDLTIPQNLLNRVLTFQVPGFKTSAFSIDSLSKLTRVEIRLAEDVTVLNEIVVTNKRLRTRVIGNRGNRKGSDIDNDIRDDINMAYATKVKGRTAPYTVNKISVYIRNPYPEKYYLRPLIMEYNPETKRPGKSLITENLYFEVGQMNGWMDLDLEGYGINAQGAIVIGVEYLGTSREQAYFAISYNFAGGENFKRVNTSDGFKATGTSSWFPYETHRKRPLINAEISY